MPIVERTDAHSIRYVGADIIEISRFLAFMLGYDSNAQP